MDIQLKILHFFKAFKCENLYNKNMKKLIFVTFLSLIALCCTQINDVPQDSHILPMVRYNYNLDSTVYDSAWVEYEDTLLVIENESGIDTFYLKSHFEERFVYGTDALVLTQVYDTVIRSYDQGFNYAYVSGGDTLTELERFPSLSSSSSLVVSSESSSNQSSDVLSSTEISSSDIIVLSSTDGVSSLVQSSEVISSSSTTGSSAVSSSSDDLRYIKINVISKSLLSPPNLDGSNYKMYMHIYYDGAGTEIDVDLDNLILRYRENYAEVNGVKFDSLSFSTLDTVPYNSNTKEITFGLNDTAKIQMYYPVDTSKTVMKISFSNYDNYFYGIVDSVAYQQYLDSLDQ
ncbi:MAG: hypothetical protein OCC49_16075 [Fibrobacterales bacterium]